MGEIKSAAEIAREKLEKMDEATEEEQLKWKYVPEGEKLAALYIKEDYNLLNELNKYEEKARKYVTEGICDILMRNIGLPKNDVARKNNKKAMEGLKAVKTDKIAAENVFSKMRNVIDHYVQQGDQQKKQAYEALKTQYEAKLQQALKKQLGSDAQLKIDVEKYPQFQEEWVRMQTQLESQYLIHLDEYKRELAAID